MAIGRSSSRWFRKRATSGGSGLHKESKGGGKTSPLLARRGGRDIKRNIAKLPLMERTGWWFKIKRKCF